MWAMGQNRRYGDPLTALDPPAIAPPTASRVRHVWVNLSYVEKVDTGYPGVIIDWRRSANGWEAQVAYVTDGKRSTLHVTWCAAEQLRPVAGGGVEPAARSRDVMR